jgi:hypothetical protein
MKGAGYGKRGRGQIIDGPRKVEKVRSFYFSFFFFFFFREPIARECKVNIRDVTPY